MKKFHLGGRCGLSHSAGAAQGLVVSVQAHPVDVRHTGGERSHWGTGDPFTAPLGPRLS